MAPRATKYPVAILRRAGSVMTALGCGRGARSAIPESQTQRPDLKDAG
jgi:hypothetical protein